MSLLVIYAYWQLAKIVPVTSIYSPVKFPAPYRRTINSQLNPIRSRLAVLLWQMKHYPHLDLSFIRKYHKHHPLVNTIDYRAISQESGSLYYYLIGNYMEKTASLREIFAKNLRENRRKCGFSQEKLAEKAGISTQYLAMMEIARKFPASEVLERLAGAMNINVYELFLIEHSPREELELLRQDIIREMKRTFGDIIEQALKCNADGAA